MKTRHYSSARRSASKLLAASIVVGSVGLAGTASAAPFVNVTVLETLAAPTDPSDPTQYGASVPYANSETVYYAVAASLAPAGTSNTHQASLPLGTQRVGTDGIN